MRRLWPQGNPRSGEQGPNGAPHPQHEWSGLSVVLPAFNEETNVRAVTEHALEVLPGLTRDFELIIVDDGSSDGTAAVATELVEEHYPRVRLLRHETNRGYGTALRSGFHHARFDLIF